MGALNFVDAERHFTKAVVGMPEAEGTSVPNERSFCAGTIVAPDGILVVPDTHLDERFLDHPLVVGGPRIGSYVGVSIVSRGERVGVLCAFGPEAREITGPEQTALVTLARQAEAQLELRRRNAELRHLSSIDPLTKLANRTLLYDRLGAALAARQRFGGEVGVLFCDVDGFKGVNDRLGHLAGDRVLCDIADDLRAAVRPVDLVARIAGDEFVVVCPDVTAAQLEVVAGRIARHERRLPDGPLTLRLSVGAVIAAPGEDATSVLSRAA